MATHLEGFSVFHIEYLSNQGTRRGWFWQTRDTQDRYHGTFVGPFKTEKAATHHARSPEARDARLSLLATHKRFEAMMASLQK